MRTCEKYGTEIINGINGCQLMKICFKCNGGFPDYSRSQRRFNQVITWDDLDYLEGRCLGDSEI